MKQTLTLLIVIVAVIVLSGCADGRQELKECESPECLEDAALNCEPAKGNYYDVYIEIKEGPQVVATSPLTSEKVKGKTCSLFLRDSSGRERTCNIPEILMSIELKQYNELFFTPLVDEQLCSGEGVRIGYGKFSITEEVPAKTLKDYLLSQEDLGDNFYNFRLEGMSYVKGGGPQVHPVDPNYVYIQGLSSAESVREEKIGEVSIVQTLVNKTSETEAIEFLSLDVETVKESSGEVREIHTRTMGDESFAFNVQKKNALGGVLYNYLYVLFRQGTYCVKLELYISVDEVTPESSGVIEEALSYAEKAMNKLP